METEVTTMEGVAPAQQAVPAPAFTGKPGNFAADMAALAAESAPAPMPAPVAPQAAPQAEAQVQPEQPSPAMAPATVPEKFKAPDGSLDTAKVDKSIVNAEAALEKYQELERKLRQSQNTVAALKQGAPVPVNAPAVPVVPVNLSPLEIQVAQDLIQAAAEQGLQLDQRLAIAQARVQVRLYEAKHSAEVSLTEQLRQRIEDQDRRRELETIAKDDSTILSPEGIEALGKIRETHPWVNQSPRPWSAAYDIYLANQARAARQPGTVLPTPTGQTAKAPPTPVSPAPRVVVQPAGPDLNKMSEADITAHVAKMTPAEEAKFWASRGLKFK